MDRTNKPTNESRLPTRGSCQVPSDNCYGSQVKFPMAAPGSPFLGGGHHHSNTSMSGAISFYTQINGKQFHEQIVLLDGFVPTQGLFLKCP